MKRLMLGLFTLLFSSYAMATVYSLPSGKWEIAPAPFTTNMTYGGTLTTAAPLAPNLINFPIGPLGNDLLTDWNITDGITTYTKANSREWGANPDAFSVSTDAGGNIVALIFVLANPATGTSVSDPVNGIEMAVQGDLHSAAAINQQPCTAVVDTTCFSAGGEGLVAFSAELAEGGVTLVPPSPIPTASTAGLTLLISLTLLMGLYFRRQV